MIMRYDVLIELSATGGWLVATVLPAADMEGHLAATAFKHNGHNCSTPSSTTASRIGRLCDMMKAQDKAS